MRTHKGSFGIMVSLLRYGKTGQHVGTARGSRLYGACSSKFYCPLVHQADADSRRLFGGDVESTITNFYSQYSIECEMDGTDMSMGVAHDVGQGFLDNAGYCYLDDGRKQRQVLWILRLMRYEQKGGSLFIRRMALALDVNTRL